ncbi:MAG TPA: VCBS repeat-containing protein [Pirellulaceae bacterium]|nr:VCBS repeat-containing protein [Pirellulaceae bacterium]
MNLRFSLRQLLVVIAVAAVACAALARPSYLWHSAIVTATVIAMMGMLIAACVGSERARPFAVGWLIIAIGYLAIVLGPWTATQVAPQLLTTKALANLEARWHATEPSPPVFQPATIDYNGDGVVDIWVSEPGYIYGQPAGGSGTILWNVNTGQAVPRPAPAVSANYSVFQSTAHWLVAVALGQVGGWLASALARRQPGSPQREALPPG